MYTKLPFVNLPAHIFYLFYIQNGFIDKRHIPLCNCLSVCVFGGHVCGVFLKTWVGRGKSREEARHTHGCARCKYLARTPRQGVSGCMYRTLYRW